MVPPQAGGGARFARARPGRGWGCRTRRFANGSSFFRAALGEKTPLAQRAEFGLVLLAQSFADSIRILRRGARNYQQCGAVSCGSVRARLLPRPAQLQREKALPPAGDARRRAARSALATRTVPIIRVHVRLNDGACPLRVAHTLRGRISTARAADGGPPMLKIRAGIARAPLGRFSS